VCRLIGKSFFNRFRNLVSFFLALTLSTPALSALPLDDSARIYFEQALKSKQEGDFLRAESLLRKAIDAQPENPDFHFELANLFVERNHLREARMEYEQLVMLAPDHLGAHYNLGLVYKELGLMGEARGQFRKALEIDPTNVKAQLQIGYVYQDQGFFDDARQAFQKAQEMDATNPEPQNALEDLPRYEEAARQKSRSDLERSFHNNPFMTGAQPGGQESLAQAGAVLLQQFMNRRKSNSETDGTT